MKAHDVTKLTAKLKSSDSVQKWNILLLVLVTWPSTAIYSPTSSAVSTPHKAPATQCVVTGTKTWYHDAPGKSHIARIYAVKKSNVRRTTA